MLEDSKLSGTVGTTEARQGTPDAGPTRARLSLNEACAVGFNTPQVILSVLVAALFIGVRLWQLTSFGLFGDETFTVNVAASAWGELIDKVIADIVHPP